MKRVGFFGLLHYVLIGLLALACVLPMILVLSISLSSDQSIKVNGYQLIPKEFSLEAYRLIFRGIPRCSRVILSASRLQYMLMKIQSEIQSLQRLQPGIPVKNLPGESLKMAACILTVGPIVLLYPYLQKYFVKGLVIGGVKG